LRAIVLGGAAALFVISAIVPSESAVPEGACAPIASGWCLLLVLWGLSLLMDEQPIVRLGWTEAAGAALVGWHSLAAVTSLGHTNGRLALNAHWLVLSYAVAAFLVRQCLRTASEARSLVAVMLWLATVLASLGIYQYAYGMPRLRAAYERDPERVLSDSGLPTEADSPQRELFENRVRSLEPLATFALTNSLAGFLAPWLVSALALVLMVSEWPKQWRALAGLVSSAALTAACLVLTKSRSAYLATAVGVVLILLYGRRRGWRLDWRIPVSLAGVTLVIGLVAVYFGGLDLEVLSEAPKSVLYRLEYWQATARMIADHPLLGVGPGNFQEAYGMYKLPRASETVADPHNFLLELWATAGTPAIVFLLALLAGFVLDLAALTAHRQPATGEENPVAPAPAVLFGGAVIGLVLGPLISGAFGSFVMDTVSESLPVPVVWLLGAVLAPAMWWLLRQWMETGELSLAGIVVPQLVLLINLLAAGAVVFPGVVSTLLVLGPLALCWPVLSSIGVSSEHAKATSTITAQMTMRLGRGSAAMLFAGCALVVMACLYTAYYPVMDGRLALNEAVRAFNEGRWAEYEAKLAAAARADSLWPEPWRLLSDFRLRRWLATGREADWLAFVEAAKMYYTLDPRHHVTWYTRGNWFLTAWKKSGRKEELNEALAAYRRASELFPSRALYHAQVAWALHLAGENAAARIEADRAWELDQQMPHREQKLNRQHVADPELLKENLTLFREETAEQTVEKLRSGRES
jgi:hypothetical protein